jgi:pyruvate dehydrogenase E2 component (dihydrolipoamide acetyltransferase)
MGRIVEQAVAVGSLLGVAPVISISLAADHRVTDGHRGAVFLNELKRILEHPEQRKV